MNRKSNILVISQTPDMAEMAQKAMEGSVEVDYASNEAEALEKVKTQHPDILILGLLASPDRVSRLYRELREGWISRHSSLLVIEKNTAENKYRFLDEENREERIGEYVLRSGTTSPFISPASLVASLKEKIQEILDERANALKASILDPQGFCVTWEQIPGLGAFETRQELVLENARKAARGDKICAISIVDNPGGNPAIATEILCSEIHKLGIEPMVHLAFRDKSRNQVESLLYQLAALDINNLLILTGDYPSSIGFQGRSRPVFDLDSVNGLQLIAEMNRGMEHEIMRKKTHLAPTDFFAGVACSPFKIEEAEVMGQYYKLKKKIEAGADFIITQIGYDFRKLQELQLWLKTHGYQIPTLISIQVLTSAAARTMNENRVPGCVVTDKLLAQIAAESQAADKGRQARLDRAARMYAVARGMGFAGACISGQGVPYENVEYIIEKGQELTRNWPDYLAEFDYPQKNSFYFFERALKKDEEKIRNSKLEIRNKFEFPNSNFQNLSFSRKNPVVNEEQNVADSLAIRIPLNSETPAPRKQKPARPLIFYLSLALHRSVFEPKSPLFKILRPVMRFIDSSRILGKAFGSVEYWTKAALYGCQNCGDCALFDVAYLCPISQCPKNQRNGPCGGSYNGWCEVYPNEKKCIWVRAYRRLKSQHKEDSIGEFIVPPCNWELWQTSSWLNYFMVRDHVSKRTLHQPESPEQ